MESHLYEQLAKQEQAHWWFKGRRSVIREVMRRNLPSAGLRILDVGCGTGGMLPMLAEFGAVEGLESSPDALSFCEKNFAGLAKIHRGSIPDDIPDTGDFDVVTAFDVLEHLDDPIAAIRRIKSALRPGGAFVCAVPAFQFLWSDHDRVHHHRKRYTADVLRTELEAGGMRVEWSSYFNSLLFPPIAAVRLLGKVLPKSNGASSDVQETPAPVNALLTALFSAERYVVPRLPLPFGVSLIAVARA